MITGVHTNSQQWTVAPSSAQPCQTAQRESNWPRRQRHLPTARSVSSYQSSERGVSRPTQTHNGGRESSQTHLVGWGSSPPSDWPIDS